MIANRIRSKSNVPAGGFQPGDFSFDDVTFSWVSEGYTNTVTFNKSGTLYIKGIPTSNLIGSNCNVNTFLLDFWLSEGMAISNADSFGGFGDGVFLYSPLYAVINVNVNDTMNFYFYNADGSPFSTDNATVELRIGSFNGTLIDSFTVTMTF